MCSSGNVSCDLCLPRLVGAARPLASEGACGGGKCCFLYALLPSGSVSFFSRFRHPRIGRAPHDQACLTTRRPHASTLCDVKIDEAASCAARDSCCGCLRVLAVRNQALCGETRYKCGDGWLMLARLLRIQPNSLLSLSRYEYLEMEDETW